MMTPSASDQYRAGPAELTHRFGDLCNLLLRVFAGIAVIGFEIGDTDRLDPEFACISGHRPTPFVVAGVRAMPGAECRKYMSVFNRTGFQACGGRPLGRRSPTRSAGRSYSRVSQMVGQPTRRGMDRDQPSGACHIFSRGNGGSALLRACRHTRPQSSSASASSMNVSKSSWFP